MLKWLRRQWRRIAATSGIISVVLALVDHFRDWGLLGWSWRWLKEGLSKVAPHWGTVFMSAVGITLALLLLTVWRKVARLENHVAMTFQDNFRRGLGKWEYEGQWTIAAGNELSVTQSEVGGITRVGHLWGDYSFEFRAVIVHHGIGWIVRAQDLFNYYMIQLTPTMVRPHLRIGERWVVLAEQAHHINIQPLVPLEIRTVTRGSEIRVFVNGQEVYYDPRFFSVRFFEVRSNDELGVASLAANRLVVPAFTNGRVGFRMAGGEHGRVSWCRVST